MFAFFILINSNGLELQFENGMLHSPKKSLPVGSSSQTTHLKWILFDKLLGNVPGNN